MESNMNKMMLEVATVGRKPLLKYQENAIEQFQSTQSQKDFNHLMFGVMNLAFWLRVDLELLLRVAYWQNISIKALNARFVYDQINLFETTLKRIGTDTERTNCLLNDFKGISKGKNITPVEPECNGSIVKKLTYRKTELKQLYSCFHKILSKLSHPDPYFIRFPEEYRHQVENNLMNSFKKCKSALDYEWQLLESRLRKTPPP